MAVAVDTATRPPLGTIARAAVTNASASVVVAVPLVINAIAFAGLICAGRLAPGLLVCVSAILSGLALSTIAIAVLSGEPGVPASTISATIVVYGLIAADVARAMPGLDPIQASHAAVIVCGLATLFAGIVFVLLGALKLGALARFLPYPVVSAYNAGIGWVFLLAGIEMATTIEPSGAGRLAIVRPDILARAACASVMAIVLLVLERKIRHWAILPATLAGGFIVFHAVRLLLGAHMPALQSSGWLLGPFAPGRIWSSPDWSFVPLVPWTQLGGLGSLAGTIVLLGAMSLMLGVSGIELELRKSLRVDRLSAADMERMERDDPDLGTLIHRAMTILISEKLAGTNRLIEQLMR